LKQFVSAISLLVPDYDAGLQFYVETLGFQLVEDTRLTPEKRWVLVAPKGAAETRLLLAKADGTKQQASIGNQAGDRVFLFLTTDDFDRDFAQMTGKGVEFLEEPRSEPYGKVAVFMDPFGNKWDLIQPA